MHNIQNNINVSELEQGLIFIYCFEKSVQKTSIHAANRTNITPLKVTVKIALLHKSHN